MSMRLNHWGARQKADTRVCPYGTVYYLGPAAQHVDGGQDYSSGSGLNGRGPVGGAVPWLYEYPYRAIGILAVTQQPVITLLGPQHNVIDIQGVGQTGFHQGLPIVLDLIGQGGEDSGAALSASVDYHPTAA